MNRLEVFKRYLRSAFLSVTIIFGVLVVGVLLAEIVGRATGLIKVANSPMRPSPTKGYELDPEHPHINQYGLRDREFALTKPPNTFRIVTLGDSFTYGAGVALEASYVKQLEVKLNANPDAQDVRYEVLNAGIPGYNTHQEFIHLQEVALQFDPDAILLGFTLSDAELGYFGLKNMGNQSWPKCVKQWMKDNVALYGFFKLRLKRLLDRVESIRHGTETGGMAVLPLRLALEGRPSEGWDLCRKSLEDFAAAAKARNIPIILAIYPFLWQLNDQYPFQDMHDLVAKTAAEDGFQVVDLLPYFKGLDASTLRISPQDGHPNASANAVAADAIYKALLSLSMTQK